MKASRISYLADVIAKQTAIVDAYLTAHGLPALSFEPDGPAKPLIPAHETEIVAAQDKVIASTQELHDLMKGPTEMLMGISVNTICANGLQVADSCHPIQDHQPKRHS